jgi:hypothetical protein
MTTQGKTKQNKQRKKYIDDADNSILYCLCAESTATRPITETEQCKYR